MGSASDAAALKTYLDENLHLTVTRIIVTHYFSDHIAALKLFPDASIIAHERYEETFARELQRTAEEKAFFVAPHHLVASRHTMAWGSHELYVFHNPGYTPCMLNIDIPTANLIHCGDTIVGEMVFLRYANLDLLKAAMQRLARKRRSQVLLSHGGPRTGAVFEQAEHYLTTLLRSFAEGHSMPSLRDCLSPGVTFGPAEISYHEANWQALSAI